jgi:hypothetical protein
VAHTCSSTSAADISGSGFLTTAIPRWGKGDYLEFCRK